MHNLAGINQLDDILVIPRPRLSWWTCPSWFQADRSRSHGEVQRVYGPDGLDLSVKINVASGDFHGSGTGLPGRDLYYTPVICTAT